MKTTKPFHIYILVGVEDIERGIFSVNLVDDSETLLWRVYIDHDGLIDHPLEIVAESKNGYIQFVLDNYRKDVIASLLKMFDLLQDRQELFSWDAEDESWMFLKPLTISNLINWREYVKEINLTNGSDKSNLTNGSINKYNKLQLVGEGSYSKVYLVEDGASGKTYIMKQISKARLKKNDKFADELNNIHREIDILKKLIALCDPKKKSYFPCYVDDVEDNEFIYIITEHAGNFKNLENYLDENNNLNSDDIQIMFKNLLKGLEELHSLGIIHKDIKPQNIMIDPMTLDIQYIDFGLSCWDTEPECINKGRGTPLYISPELYYRLNSKTPLPTYSAKVLKKSDIWALGLVFFIILMGYHPFFYFQTQSGLTKHMVNLYNGKTVLSVTDISDPLYQNLVGRMLSPIPENRATIGELENIMHGG